jgi:hypothetical protein
LLRPGSDGEDEKQASIPLLFHANRPKQRQLNSRTFTKNKLERTCVKRGRAAEAFPAGCYAVTEIAFLKLKTNTKN